MPKAMGLRIGVIGLGYWGPNIMRNFVKLENARVLAVADADPRKLETVKRIYPWVSTFSSGQELIEKAEVEAIAVATPLSTHYALAKAALNNDKHLLIEKPMTATVSQGEELLALAKNKGKVLMVDQTFVYSGAVKKIRELIKSGVLGEIHYYDSVRVNLGLFQHDINVVWDLAPHDLSMMLYLLDKEPVSLSAVGAKPVRWNGWNLESLAYLSIRFSDGTLAHMHVNWLSPVKIRRTLIGGDRKMIVYDHLDPDNQVKIFDKGVEVTSEDQVYGALVQYRTGDMLAPKVDQTEALENVCGHFVECVEKKKVPTTDGEFGIKVVRLLELAQRSIDHDGQKIEIKPSALCV